MIACSLRVRLNSSAPHILPLTKRNFCLQIYDPALNDYGWKAGAPLPLYRSGMGQCIFHAGKIYVFGGEVEADTPAPSTTNKITASRTVYRVDVYDIASNSWSLATVWQQLLACYHSLVTTKMLHPASDASQQSLASLYKQTCTVGLATPVGFNFSAVLSCKGGNIKIYGAGHAGRA
jgi:hypothetical protein